MQKLIKTIVTVLLSSTAVTLAAAPIGYSINSDSASDNADSLYRIDLATGQESRVASVISQGEKRIDVEGLAFAPDGTLYGIDDASRTLFPLNPDNAVVDTAHEVPVSGLQSGSNDFGMTFACDGSLYITSIAKGALYRMDLDGTTDIIGSEGSLGVKINALAAYGDPVRLYGLGNGMDENQQVTTPNLYEINTSDGTAVLIGALENAGNYSEGGLSFDDQGQLWAITDRRALGLPSQVMKINRDTGVATEIRETVESGFESLAISVPRGCNLGGGPNAEFKVQKQFTDGNDQLPAVLNIRCNTGVPLEQSLVVQPNPGPLGSAEVTFVVGNFEDGALDCEIWEDTPANYTASYSCYSTGACQATETSCTFTGTQAGQDNLCTIRNNPEPVTITVSSEFLFDSEELVVESQVAVELSCRNVLSGDGDYVQGVMKWNWLFDGNTPDQTATIQPAFDNSTECRIESSSPNSAVESVSNCDAWTTVPSGSGELDCEVVNTVFFEGIPTLGRGGLLLASLLMLLTGLVFVRRF